MIENTHTRSIRLDHEEAEYLKNVLGVAVGKFIADAANNAVSIQLNESESEELREELTIRLAQLGFDHQYSPNREGTKIESLIDKLFLSRELRET